MKVSAVLLAAGQGTRMHSDTPKVLHLLCGKPMLWHSLQAIRQASTEKPVVIVGHAADQVKAYVGMTAECVVQEPQLGTAHAVLAGRVTAARENGSGHRGLRGHAAAARRRPMRGWWRRKAPTAGR